MQDEELAWLRVRIRHGRYVSYRETVCETPELREKGEGNTKRSSERVNGKVREDARKRK
jgi:hypothetical protein